MAMLSAPVAAGEWRRRHIVVIEEGRNEADFLDALVDSKRYSITERYIVYADAALGARSVPETSSADLGRSGVS